MGDIVHQINFQALHSYRASWLIIVKLLLSVVPYPLAENVQEQSAKMINIFQEWSINKLRWIQIVMHVSTLGDKIHCTRQMLQNCKKLHRAAVLENGFHLSVSIHLNNMTYFNVMSKNFWDILAETLIPRNDKMVCTNFRWFVFRKVNLEFVLQPHSKK